MRRFAGLFACAALFSLFLPAIALAGGKPVVFAVAIGDSVKATVEKFQPLMDYLSKKTGRPFEVRPVKDYDAIVDGFKSHEFGGGVLGSGVGGRAVRDLGAVPVARPVVGGVSTYQGYIIVRKDSGIKTFDGLKGKRFDLGRKNNSAGDLFALSLVADRKTTGEQFFSSTLYSGKYEDVIYKVLNKDVDGGGLKSSVYEKVAKDDPRIGKELLVIAKSSSFPDMTHFLARDVPGELTASVRKALLSIGGDPDGKAALAALGADKYVETTPKDFASVQKMLKKLGR